MNQFKNIDISVIIPCFNQGKFLENAIDSVEALYNDDLNIEIIIVNDGSTDAATIDILHSNRLLQHKVIHQPNGGLSNARNTGLKYSSGKFIQFLDSDDIIINNKFDIQMSFFKQDPDLSICVSSFLCSKENIDDRYQELGALSYCDNNYPSNEFLFNWERGFTVPIHCALFKKEDCFFDDSLLFDEVLQSKEDWFMWCRLALLNKKFKFHEDIMAIYRVHNTSMCRDITKSILGFISASAKISNLIKDHELLNSFIQSTEEHIRDAYLKMYEHQILEPIVQNNFRTKTKNKLKKIDWFMKLYSRIKSVRNK